MVIQMTRRTLTIKTENDSGVQILRSILLGLTPPIDIDYTTALNLLLSIGLISFYKIMLNKEITRDDITKVMSTYVTDEALKDEAVYDRVMDVFLKNIPKLLGTINTTVGKINDEKASLKSEEKIAQSYIS
jgi:hypothetical protein